MFQNPKEITGLTFRDNEPLMKKNYWKIVNGLVFRGLN